MKVGDWDHDHGSISWSNKYWYRVCFFKKNHLKMICGTDPCGSYTVLPLMLWPPAMKVDESHEDQDRVPSRVGNRIWNITHTCQYWGVHTCFLGAQLFFENLPLKGGKSLWGDNSKGCTHLAPIWYHNMASFRCWEYATKGYKRYLFWPIKDILLFMEVWNESHGRWPLCWGWHSNNRFLEMVFSKCTALGVAFS